MSNRMEYQIVRGDSEDRFLARLTAAATEGWRAVNMWPAGGDGYGALMERIEAISASPDEMIRVMEEDRAKSD